MNRKLKDECGVLTSIYIKICIIKYRYYRCVHCDVKIRESNLRSLSPRNDSQNVNNKKNEQGDIVDTKTQNKTNNICFRRNTIFY